MHCSSKKHCHCLRQPHPGLDLVLIVRHLCRDGTQAKCTLDDPAISLNIEDYIIMETRKRAQEESATPRSF